ncbi:hypothetical protein ABN028_15280 [Actinopolymorpha sp. B17G11]|uniref:hypothetical protein n=1 Tax=Actinopolymorpha sp. B17G11 TaxID=3160861 RepID=UPI0032E3F2CC
MYSNKTHEPSLAPLTEIDPIALGQAGLQALALAGTAILARYARSQDRADEMADLEGTLPHPDRSILMSALGAFAEPQAAASSGEEDVRRQADAVAAMCLRARTTLTRQDRLVPGARQR